jgi:phage terminase large subunit-like protein
MRGFVEWLDERGFWIRDKYDPETRTWESGGFRLELEPHQREILEYCLTPDENGRFPFKTIIYSCTKKSGKSAIGAAVAAWAAEEFPEGSEIFIAANNREQVEGRIMRDLKYHIRRSPNLYPIPLDMQDIENLTEDEAHVTQYRVTYPNETFVQALTKNASGNAGSRHALTVWDELWGYTTPLEREMWNELTPIPTVPVSIRFVATYAGFMGKSDLLWDLYQRGVGPEEHEDGRGEMIPDLGGLPCYRNGDLFVYWDRENRMPWQTKEYLKSQFDNEKPHTYLRFHENRWVSSKEAYLPDGWWDRAIQVGKDMDITSSADFWLEHPYRNSPMVLGVDVSWKSDSSAVVGTVYDPAAGKVIQMTHRIWAPVEGEVFDLWETVGLEILRLKSLFSVTEVYYDPTQFHQVSVELLKRGVNMLELSQTNQNLVAISKNLYDLLKGGNLVTYEDELAAQHISKTVSVDTGRGFRIVKERSRDAANKIDFALALAMSAWGAVAGGGEDRTEDIEVHSQFSDQTHWERKIPGEEHLPFALRS